LIGALGNSEERKEEGKCGGVVTYAVTWGFGEKELQAR
jgi:hypothetical protein